jgi:hypothetical protein
LQIERPRAPVAELGSLGVIAPVKHIHYIFIFCVLLVLSGCASRKTVTVVDDSGTPIQGARVVVQAMSIEGVPAITAADGVAKVDMGVVGAQMVAVSKQGFQTEQIRIPATWPLKVVLKKETPKP